jgi:RDD family
MRFDEVELEAVLVPDVVPAPALTPTTDDAPRWRRLLALFTDLSLFAALALALSPLLPSSFPWMQVLSLAGFVVVVSYYYFVGSWLLWGKSIGGAIFDVRVVPARPPMALRHATLRWLGLYLSLATGGIGFLLAALPSRLSLADRISRTRCVAG